MTGTATEVRLRPLREDDFEAIAEIATANFPDTPRTAGEARARYGEFDDTRFQREWLVAEDEAVRPVAYGFWQQDQWQFHPHKVEVYAAVHPARQRQGIGTRLMTEVLGRVRARGAQRVKSWAREDYAGALAFLDRFGFREYNRAFESRLPVAACALSRFSAAEARARQAGVTFTTLAEELARDPGCLRAVYQAHETLGMGTPHSDPDLPTPQTYEHWAAHDVHHERALPEAYFLAKAGDLYVGESALKRSETEPDVLWQELTAVLPEYRRHSIAMALKVRTVAYAQAHGLREIRTFNSSKNAPMLAINTKLGFVRQPAWIDFLLEPARG